MKKSNLSGKFSLTELIILIVVIVILAALLIPMRSTSREEATMVGCADNLRQSINALLMYGNNNDGWICTYGNQYSGWYAQHGVSDSLGFKIAKAGRSPLTERPVTLCPDIWINAPSRNVAQAYGAAWFIPRGDYDEFDCEKVVDLKTNLGQMVHLEKLPNPTDYVLLADSSYTITESANIVPGVQCMLFARQKVGATSHLPRAISLRHKGEANIGYADGHLGDTSDRIAMLMKSKIGAYIDATGQKESITR